MRPRRRACVPIDVQAMHIDLLAFPGHKSLLGPTGTGALYVGPRAPRAAVARGRHRRRLVQRDAAERHALLPGRRHAERPRRRRPGRRHPLRAGAGPGGHPRATRWTWSSGCGGGWTRCRATRSSATATAPRRVATLSFRSEALPAAEIGGILDQAFDIAIRPGPALRPVHPPRPRHVPRRHRARQPGAVQHRRRHRPARRRPARDVAVILTN